MNYIKDRKIQEVIKIKDLIKRYKSLGIINLTNLPSANLQLIRNKLRDKLEVKVVKKGLIERAIDELGEKNLTLLKPYLKNCIPALIFSNENPFKLFKLVRENKKNVAAKPGQIAPSDLNIPAGPTQFTPGPIIGELGAVGLQTSVESGKIVIKKDKVIAKKGETIKPEVASVLSKLGIEPIEITANILGVYNQGLLYEKTILDINQEEYINNIILAYNQAINISEAAGYISNDNVELLLIKAYRTTFRLSQYLKLDVNTEIQKTESLEKSKKEEKVTEEQSNNIEETKEIKEEKESGGFVGYTKEVEEKAQEILKDLQDKKIQEQKKPKHKSMWD